MCRELGSPLWGAALDGMAADVAGGGPTLRVLKSTTRQPIR